MFEHVIFVIYWYCEIVQCSVRGTYAVLYQSGFCILVIHESIIISYIWKIFNADTLLYEEGLAVVVRWNAITT